MGQHTPGTGCPLLVTYSIDDSASAMNPRPASACIRWKDGLHQQPLFIRQVAWISFSHAFILCRDTTACQPKRI